MEMVSVIIPVYKSREVLKTAVESVLSQSYRDFEILLVDDGSPDDSLKLCYELQSRDARIKVFHKENGGICSARNYGIDHARGKYVAFLDHDDEYKEGYLEENIKLLEKYQADIIKFERVKSFHRLDGKIINIHGNRINNMPGVNNGVLYIEGNSAIGKSYSAIRKAVKAMFIWDGIYRLDFIRRNSLHFDESFKFGCEDVMFNYEMLSVAESIIFNPHEYYIHKYRQATSTSAKFDENRVKDTIKTAKREVQLLQRWNYSNEDVLFSYLNHYYSLLTILSLPSTKCSLKRKKELIEDFRVNTIAHLPNINKITFNLLKRHILYGFLAIMLNNRWYSISLFSFRIYNEISLIKARMDKN